MRLFRNYLSLHLKTRLEYKSSFILGLISQGLYMLLELYAVYSLFKRFNLMEIYNKYEVYLGFSTIWFGYSMCEFFGRGFDCFYKIIVNGKFDLLLIRPRNIYIQIVGEDICYEKISRVVLGFIIFIYSACKVITDVSILKILLLVLMVVGCMIIIFSLFIIAASICFKTIQGIEIINVLTNGTKQVAEYPMKIYNGTIRMIFTIFIPICLVNYYPIDYLVGRSNNILYVFLPLLTLGLLLISILIFNSSIKKYCSTGS